jgi:ketosteroid isomerase-like protein
MSEPCAVPDEAAAVRSGARAAPAAGVGGAALLAIVLACAGSRPARTQPAPVVNDSATQASMAAAQEIAQLHTRWSEALAKQDTVFLSQTLLDNFQLTGGQATLTKEQFLIAVASDTGGVAPSRFEQTSVRLYGNVAVVTGLIRYDIPGEAAPAVTRYTEVWVQEGRHWRAAHLHYNPVPPATQGERRTKGSNGTQP